MEEMNKKIDADASMLHMIITTCEHMAASYNEIASDTEQIRIGVEKVTDYAEQWGDGKTKPVTDKLQETFNED